MIAVKWLYLLCYFSNNCLITLIGLITEKYLEKQKDIYACFIDYSKAFDTVKHQELLQCLKTTDIEENYIALIANLYWQQKTIVKINNDISEPLKIEKGVRQGCVLSPALFNLYTDIIFRNIDQRPGIKIGGHTINNLRYADDTVLLAENETELQQIFGHCQNSKREIWTLHECEKNKKYGILQE